MWYFDETAIKAIAEKRDGYLDIKPLFDKLARESLTVSQATWQGIRHFAGQNARFVPHLNAMFTALESFEPASSALNKLPIVTELYENEAGQRLSLQFIYGLHFYLVQQVGAGDVDQLIDLTWDRFWETLNERVWKYSAIAGLACFQSDIDNVGLGEGVRLLSLNVAQACEMFWCPDESSVHARFPGAHLILATRELPKTSQNAYTTIAGGETYTAITDALAALRLASQGNIIVGSVYYLRLGFNLGDNRDGRTLTAVGDDSLMFRFDNIYRLTDEIAAQARHWNTVISKTRVKLPQNIVTGLRWFSSSFDRSFGQELDQVVDLVTALEALVGFGDKSELTFKGAFRVASILANNDDERVDVLKGFKKWYTIRSTIVHGGSLNDAQNATITDCEPLRGYVRQLLQAFLTLVNGGHIVSKSRDKSAYYYDEKCVEVIDQILMHNARLRQFRINAGLYVE